MLFLCLKGGKNGEYQRKTENFRESWRMNKQVITTKKERNKIMAKNIYLTPHFTLEEMTRTSVKLGYLDRQRQTQPGEQVTENLTRVCQWLEMLRQRYNEKYNPLQTSPRGGFKSLPLGGDGEGLPIVINSGYRCKELNRLVGGCPSSNHLTGCAADLRVAGKEQLLRYVTLLLDISDEWHQDFDELLLERNARGYWLHFAVRPKNNRRKILLINVI